MRMRAALELRLYAHSYVLAIAGLLSTMGDTARNAGAESGRTQAIMAQARLTLVQFQDLLDRLGDDWEGWPAAERQRAKELLARSPKAAAMLAEAQALRGAVQAKKGKAPAGLVDRIVAGAMKASPPGAKSEKGARATRPRRKS
jgi:hypothetical protein